MRGRTLCRACGGQDIYCYLRLGDHPPANAFIRAENLDHPEVTYPLDTHVCLDCALIQVPDPLPIGYYTDYVYVPSASDTMPVHFQDLARRFAAERSAGELIIDVGSNDGLLLAACKSEGLRTLGVDPSDNISELAAQRGIAVHRGYFTEASAAEILAEHGVAHIIVTTNTINHVDDVVDFIKGVDILLAPDGEFVVEVPQALTCVLMNEFDTVYHEHLSTFSVESLIRLTSPVGLRLVEVEELPIHGGSMRCRFRRFGDASPMVVAYLKRERDAGLFSRSVYDEHAARVHRLRDDLSALLAEIKASGRRVAGYSAPAKGNTLLNYFRIGPETIDWIADRNVLKQGRYTPGMHIPVVSPEAVLEERPDFLLVLAWNFREEIIAQHREYLSLGGRLIIPVPQVEVVG